MSEVAGAEQVSGLEGKLREAEGELAKAREALGVSERTRAIERELAREGAVDVETAALLTEAAVAGMEKADVAAAVGELKRAKPFLFRAAAGRGSAMAGEPGEGGGELEEAAAVARETGDRRVLLRYLRMKRGE